jgi:Ni/Co efflux regulator RcnB
MQSKKITCLVTAAALGFGTLGFAQDRDNDRDHHGGARQEQRHDDRGEHRDADRQDHYYYGARGPEWHRGGHVPAQYRDHQYVVDNWRDHHLAPPPRGYHWVQVGNDYVLAAIATGLIAQLILNNS